MPCVLKRLASWLPSPCGSQTAVHAMERQTQILTSAHYKIFTPDQTIQFCYGSRTSLRIIPGLDIQFDPLYSLFPSDGQPFRNLVREGLPTIHSELFVSHLIGPLT